MQLPLLFFLMCQAWKHLSHYSQVDYGHGVPKEALLVFDLKASRKEHLATRGYTLQELLGGMFRQITYCTHVAEGSSVYSCAVDFAWCYHSHISAEKEEATRWLPLEKGIELQLAISVGNSEPFKNSYTGGKGLRRFMSKRSGSFRR